MKNRVKIIDIINEGKDVKTYLLDKPNDITWEEGSHFHIAMLGFDEGDKPNKSLVRHMSIMTLPEENKLGFTTRIPKEPSEFKQRLSKLTVGDEVVIFKIGSRMQLRRSNRPIVLLSMGVGIATMRPLIHSFMNDSSDIPNLVHINVDASNKLYQRELEPVDLDQYKNYWVDSRDEYYKTLKSIMKKQGNAIYYIVGSDSFIKANIQHLRMNMVKDTDIILDKKDELLGEYFN